MLTSAPTEFDCGSVNEIPLSECQALVALYNGTNGAGWTNSTGWLVTNTPCSWSGVSCHNGHVTNLTREYQQLNGSIPPGLGNLANLNSLYLRGNQLSGSIPPELGNLTYLQILHLDYNQLSGSIPPELGALTGLREFSVSNNQLSGNIPPQLGNLTNVQYFELHSNQLSGSIPPELGNFGNALDLRLANNHLSGSIPSQLGSLANLQALYLDSNQLSGSIPSQLGNLTNLQALDLKSNQLSGGVPTELGNLITLGYLLLSSNPLSGELPQSLTQLPLTWFWFDNTTLCEPGDIAFQAWLTGIAELRRTNTICGATLTHTPTSTPSPTVTPTATSAPAWLIHSDHWQVRYQDSDPGGTAWQQFDYDDSDWGYPAKGNGAALPEPIWSPTNFVPAPPQVWYGRHPFVLTSLPSAAQLDMVAANDDVVIWLNGTQIYYDWNGLASGANNIPVAADLLRLGANVLALQARNTIGRNGWNDVAVRYSLRLTNGAGATVTPAPTQTPYLSPTPTTTSTATATAAPTSTPTATDTPTAIPTDTPTVPTTATPTPTPASSQVMISEIQVTNLSARSFTVSWITNLPGTGQVRFGTDPANLNQLTNDVRGVDTVDDTHYITLSGLAPDTTYTFNVLSGEAIDDNGGLHYTATTGPELSLPASDAVYGRVFKQGGATYAGGAIVTLAVLDVDGHGSPGSSSPLSALVSDSSGYWYLNLAQSRTSSYTAYFAYSAAGDRVSIHVEGAADCRSALALDTSGDSPAPDIVLSCNDRATVTLTAGWNLVALPLQPVAPLTAQDLLDQVNAQGNSCSEIDRWRNGGWDAHINTLPFNNFAVELGQGYFAKCAAGTHWTVEGQALSSGVSLSLQPGWNLISLPYAASGYQAESLLGAIIPQGGQCSEVDRWLNGGWDAHINNLPFNDFAIEPDKGYFLKCSQASTFVPS